MDDEERASYIKDVYDGDEEQYERDFSSEAIALQNAHVISWDDLFRSTTVLPELTQRAKDIIELFLGYLPAEATTIKYEPFLRSLLQQADTGQISEDEFDKYASDHIKLIRNRDVRFDLADDYDEAMYESYHKNYITHIIKARERLVTIIGYEPQLKHSLRAELWLGGFMAKDTVRLPPELVTGVDFKAIALIRYREALLAKGKAFADDWPIPKFDAGLSKEGERGPACT